jgi:GT2 family glycosyltransferase
MSRNKTLCVILHYGEEAETWNCLDSIVGKDFLDIIVADNDPTQKIEIPERLKNRAKIFRTGGTAGFAKANNMAVSACRNASHGSVLLLNNDTVVLADALDRLLRLLESKNIGAVGPCISFLSCPEQIWACGGFIRKCRISIGGLREIKCSEPYDVDYLPGAAILCKLSVWDRVGGLPDKYFLAYEEAEFALQIRKLNLRVIVDPMAKILHKVGCSSNHENAYIYNGIRNRLKFGTYLWGKLIGFNLAAFMTLIRMCNMRLGFRIWLRAVLDEMRNFPLNRKALQNVKHDFG